MLSLSITDFFPTGDILIIRNQEMKEENWDNRIIMPDLEYYFRQIKKKGKR